MRWIRLILLMLFLSGCKVLAGEGITATLEAGNRAFATEAASLAGTAVVQRTDVALKVNAAGTEISRVNSVNENLFATLVVGSTATVAVVPTQVDPVLMGAAVDQENGDRRFIVTGMSDTVDPTTGCVVNARTSFSGNEAQLYVTMESYNVQAGTPMRAEWFYEGNLRIQQLWTVDLTSADRCLWFQIDTADTTFSPGTWSVALFVDEQNIPIDEPITFTINREG